MKLVLAVYNSKYIHSSLAPWCLVAGMNAYAPEIPWVVKEGTINQPMEQLVGKIVKETPDIVGFSVYIWNKEITLQAVQVLKQQNKNCIVVLGGPEVSYNAKEILEQYPEVDYILSGEGEESLPAFCKAYYEGRNPAKENIAGLCTREQPQTPPAILQMEPPNPYLPEYFFALKGRIAYIETTRGCPYRCAFCLSGRCGPVRCFDLKNSLEKIEKLANSGAKTVKFVDRTFNANPARATAIWSWILQEYGKSLPTGVCFHFEIAGDILKEEHFTILEKFPVGAVQLEIGLQSFHEPTLQAIHRKTNCEKLKNNIRRLMDMKNIHIHIDLIAGLPLETLEIFSHSFDTAFSLRPQMLQLGFLKLLHGADMREKKGEYPCHFDTTPPYQVIDTPWISKEELEKIHKVEDATERLYNSGRFLRTVEYLLQSTQLSPFWLFYELAIEPHSTMGLDDYTAFIQNKAEKLPFVEKETLRDVLCIDRLESNGTGKLPSCLQRKDPNIKKYRQVLKEKFPTKQGEKRGIAILYGQDSVAWVDYGQAAHAVTARRAATILPLKEILEEI